MTSTASSPLRPTTRGPDAGADGLRLGWTDDFGYASMYAFEESPRVIAAVRDAAKGFTTLGAELDMLDETWEDFYPGLGGTMHLFAGTGARVDKEVWNSAIDLRNRNWQRFRAVFGDHDLIVSATAQILAPKMEDWASYWGGSARCHSPTTRSRRTTPATRTCSTGSDSRPSTFPPGSSTAYPLDSSWSAGPAVRPPSCRAAHAFLAAFPRPERPTLS